MTRSTCLPLQPKRTFALRTLLSATLLAAFAAGAANAEPSPPRPPGPPPAPSAEELATLPSLTTQQQVELRKLLLERRDAHESLHAKSRDLIDAQRRRDRLEDERIDEASSERVRKLLGDEGFRQYAQWQLFHRGPPGGRADGPGPRGPNGPGGRGGDRDGKPGARPDAPPPPPAIGALAAPAPADADVAS